MHTLLSGRSRKNIKAIESATGTAIYFPPPFPRIYGYTPRGASRRHPDEIFITGKRTEDIAKAELMLSDLVSLPSIRFLFPLARQLAYPLAVSTGACLCQTDRHQPPQDGFPAA